MLCSRKIVSVKVLRGEHDANSNKLYVKSVIKNSYGETTRKCVIQFDSENIPEKSHCECPVGLSEICCHILVSLLFLKHFNDTGEKLLELNPTEQLQKCLLLITIQSKNHWKIQRLSKC